MTTYSQEIHFISLPVRDRRELGFKTDMYKNMILGIFHTE